MRLVLWKLHSFLRFPTLEKKFLGLGSVWASRDQADRQAGGRVCIIIVLVVGRET